MSPVEAAVPIARTALAVALVCVATGARADWCSVDGAFGLSFGDHVPRKSTRVFGGEASIWYAIKPPEPEPLFDLYLARVDTASGEIFEVVAHDTVTPRHAKAPETFTDEELADGEALAISAAARLLEMLPTERRDQTLPSDDAPQGWAWQIKVDSDALLRVGVSFPTEESDWAWSASVSCLSLSRELALGKRVLPELFESSPQPE